MKVQAKMSNKYDFDDLLKKRKRSLSICVDELSIIKHSSNCNKNEILEISRVKSCLKRNDNSPYSKFQKCIAQKEAQMNMMAKQKRVQFSTELNDCLEFN